MLHELAQVTVNITPAKGVSLSQFVTPLATFASAVIGVAVGGRIARRNLVESDTRRAQVEDEREARRREHEERAELRRVQGTARALRVDFEQTINKLEVSERRRVWWPDAVTVTVLLSREEQTLLATWFRPTGWEIVAIALHVLSQSEAERSTKPLGAPELEDDSITHAAALAAVRDAIVVINREVDHIDARPSS